MPENDGASIPSARSTKNPPVTSSTEGPRHCEAVPPGTYPNGVLPSCTLPAGHDGSHGNASTSWPRVTPDQPQALVAQLIEERDHLRARCAKLEEALRVIAEPQNPEWHSATLARNALDQHVTTTQPQPEVHTK